MRKDIIKPSSRYYAVPTGELERSPGRTVVYLKRRFVPPADAFDVIQEYRIDGDERLDRLAAALMGNPELFWRLCDANNALRPNELVEEIGRLLRVTLPEGIKEAPGA